MTILQYKHGALQQESTAELNSKFNKQYEPNYLLGTHSEPTVKPAKKLTLDERKKLQAKEMMTTPVVTARKQDVVSNVINTLEKADISHIVIINSNNTPLALINISQLTEASSPNRAFMLDFCQSQVLAVQEHTSVREIAKIFIEYKTSAICVTDNANQLTGIICRNDLLNLLASGTVES